MISETFAALWTWRRGQLLLALSFSVLSAASEAGLLLLLLLLLKRLGLPASEALPQQLQAVVPDWSAALIAFVLGSVGQGALARANALRQQRLGFEFGDDLTTRLLEMFAAMPFSRLRQLESAEITHLLAEDVAQARQAAQSLIGMIGQALLCFVYVAGTLLIAPLTAVAVGVLAIPVVLVNRGKAWMKDSMELRDSAEQLTEAASDYALNVRTLRAHERVSTANQRVLRAARNAGQRMAEFQLHVVRQGRNQQLIVVGFFAVFVVLLEFVGGGGASRLLPMAVIYLRLAPRIQGLQQQRLILSLSTGGLRAIARTLHNPVETQKHGQPIVFGDITLCDLRFEYAPGKLVLSLDAVCLRAGSWTTIVGVSGSGKSTLLRLLTGIEGPTEGSIQVGGVPLEALDPLAWRRQLAHVEQTSSFFHGTLQDNLTDYVDPRPQRADSELPSVLEVCGLGAIIARLPAGLSTMIDERASQFSSGQKQRLALARALLRRPQLLLLDEATNALDEASEAVLLTALRRHLPAATIVIASHRSATIALGDAVLHL